MNTVKRSTAVFAVAVLSGLGAVAVTVSGTGPVHPGYATHAGAPGPTATPSASDGASPSNEDWG